MPKPPGMRMLIEDRINNDDSDECWIFPGNKSNGGYGLARFFGVMRSTHKYAYEYLNGAVPDDLVIDHLCRTRACFNPKHLEAVTLDENIARGRHNWRREITNCPQGHPYDETNTYTDSQGYRHCKRCMYLRNKFH